MHMEHALIVTGHTEGALTMHANDVLGFSILLVSGSALVIGLVRQFVPNFTRRRRGGEAALDR